MKYQETHTYDLTDLTAREASIIQAALAALATQEPGVAVPFYYPEYRGDPALELLAQMNVNLADQVYGVLKRRGQEAIDDE